MKLEADTAARIRSAIAELGNETIPDRAGRQHNALPLYADIGGAVLLRADGIFLELEWDQSSEQRPNEREVPSWPVALIAGSARYPWLSTLLPTPPATATECQACGGRGRITDGGASDGYFYCAECGGLGWVSPAV